jgi:hypothetical protein
MSVAEGIVFPVEVTVRAWEIERGAPMFSTQHQYVEMLWLPVIGPSAVWMLRRLAGWALACPQGVTVVLPELSEALGLGWSSGTSSSVQRTLRRLVMFGLSAWDGELWVRTMVHPVSDRQLSRLSSGLVRAHDRMIAATADRAA